METIFSKGNNKIYINLLQNEERHWFNFILDISPHIFCLPMRNILSSVNWKVCLKGHTFMDWLKYLRLMCLFFDGASKLNLSQVSAGGFIIDHLGSKSVSFDLELCIEYNNRDGAYGFLLGVQILCEGNFKNLIVMGDSIILIHKMVKSMIPKKTNLGKIVS